MTIASAVAPPGGCREFVRCMAKIAVATATAAATSGLGMSRKQVTPISDEIKWLPTKGQGCAIGVCGAANNSTDEAPIEAMSNGAALSPRFLLMKAAKRMP